MKSPGQTRKMRRFLLLVLLSMTSVNLLGADPPARSRCSLLATAFLTRPSQRTLAALVNEDEKSCWSVFDTSDPQLDRLERSSQQGNRWAAEYLAKHLHQLDGGNLEDALAALGQFSEHDTKRLFLFAEDGLISKRNLLAALTMLPPSLDDDPRAQLAALAFRRRKVAAIELPELVELKSAALLEIDSFEAEIRRNN